MSDSHAHAERFDELLLNIAGQCGGIEPLLDTFYSFLFRKTDFFHVMQEGDRMGFPDGVAEKILLHGFRKYMQLAKQAVASRAEVSTVAPLQISLLLKKTSIQYAPTLLTGSAGDDQAEG